MEVMSTTTRSGRWSALRLAVAAWVCLAFFLVVIVAAVATSSVIPTLIGVLSIIAFVASLPLGLAAWRIGARELKTRPVAGVASESSPQASRGLRWGRSAALIWALLVLYAMLTYTAPLPPK